MPIIKLQTEIIAPIEIVFDLSRSIDLHKRSTKQTNEEAIGGRTSGLIGDGETVTWRAKHFGVYQTLTSKITEFDSPNRFVDEMIDGIFKSFRHEHRFESNNNETTTLFDVFDYSSPFGIFGRIADKLFLKNYMKKLLEKRNEIIKEFAENGKWKTYLSNVIQENI